MTNDLNPHGDTLLRSAQTYAEYHGNPKRTAPGCFICDAPTIADWRLWKVIANDFPYDAVAAHHLMLVPKRHVGKRGEIDFGEYEELIEIREWLDQENYFDAVIENLARGRTFTPHFHLHLVQWKRI